MKKTLLVVFCFIAISAMGQDGPLQNKNGRIILPQMGDYAIGISANPILNFAGNIFNDHPINTLGPTFLNGNTLFGKYFISDQTALRVKGQISYTRYKIVHTTVDQEIDIAAGYEKRRGSDRFQLLYGPEFILGSDYVKVTYTGGETEKEGSTYMGLRAFAGVEYFIFPKLSLGAEMGLSFRSNVGGDRYFLMRNDIMNGQILLLIHF
jgi:hypothetical protein